MYQCTELFSELSPEDSNATLKACDLPNKDEYLEDEAERFRKCRELIESGKTYKQAAAYFRRLDKNVASPDGTDGVEELEGMLNISELLALASTQCEQRITLKEAAQILDSCGLPDTEQYSSEEGDRFLEACSMLLKQNKSHQEVAANFGANANDTDGDIEVQVEETATNLDQSGNGIVSEIMRSKAKADASAAASMYLKHLSNEFGSPEFQAAWQQMESALRAKVMGKSQQRARQLLGEIRTIPPSTSPLNTLPEASDNGSTTN